jgi:hydrogenase expression/formation protein HypC
MMAGCPLGRPWSPRRDAWLAAKGDVETMCLGVPGRIVEISNREQMLAVADISGVRRTVNITCIVGDDHPIDSCVGDWVLIHVGFAMARIDEAEAAATLKTLAEIGELQDEMALMRASDMR